MSLKAERSDRQAPFGLEHINTKRESGKRAFRFPLFRAPPGLWECGNRVVCDFQGLWARRKTCLWFSSASIVRHFHSPPLHAVRFFCASKLANKRRFASCIRRAASVSL